MRVDTANRTFLVLLGASLLAYALIGAVACVLLGLIAYRASVEGIHVLTSDGDLRPALVFLGVVGAGAIIGFLSLRRQIGATERLALNVRRLRLPDEAAGQWAIGAGSDRRLEIVDVVEAFSFTYGMLRPVVVVSRGLLESLDPDELEAVLEHERYHVRNRDPLKVLIARTLSRGLFFTPVLADLQARYLAGRELAADRRAMESRGRRPLVGALYRMAEGPGWPELGTAAAIGGPDFLDVRVAQIETDREPAIPWVRTRGVLLTAAAVAAIGWSLGTTDLGGAIAFMRSMNPMGTTGQMALPVLGVVLCGLFWAAVGWGAYRWLAWRRRTSRLTTTTIA